jgi:hypothetical protein
MRCPLFFNCFVFKPFLHIITRFQLLGIEMFYAIWLGEENQCSVVEYFTTKQVVGSNVI